MEYSHIPGQTWGLAFTVNGLKYKGTATRMFHDRIVFFDLRFNNEGEPISEGYQSTLYASAGDSTVKWESKKPVISAEFLEVIGPQIEEKVKGSGLSIF
jgi:hypothetical protein